MNYKNLFPKNVCHNIARKIISYVKILNYQKKVHIIIKDLHYFIFWNPLEKFLECVFFFTKVMKKIWVQVIIN
jgi:hypothetical protein